VLILAIVGLLLLPESWRIATTLTLGAVSYSLYLWHWPVIVLARWTIGLTAFTLLPVLALIALCTIFSYRLEGLFRYGQPTGLGHPWVLYPAMTVLASVVSLGLQGPLMGRLFAGQRSHAVGGSLNMKRIDGTTVDTVHCFQEPTDPIPKKDVLRACRADASPGRPTLYFVGESHTHMLIPLGGKLLASGGYNVAFLARGGCPVPDFSRWEDGAAIPARYRLCRPSTDHMEQMLLDRLRPEDRIVLVSNLTGYLSNLKGPARERAQASYATAIRLLGTAVVSRGAGMVIFAPLPTVPQAKLSGPLTLCQPEWFRPSWSQAPQCRPVQQPRAAQIAATDQVRSFLQRLVAEVPGTALFDPFDSVCPPRRRPVLLPPRQQPAFQRRQSPHQCRRLAALSEVPGLPRVSVARELIAAQLLFDQGIEGHGGPDQALETAHHPPIALQPAARVPPYPEGPSSRHGVVVVQQFEFLLAGQQGQHQGVDPLTTIGHGLREMGW
jgi:hypothetical protein